MEELARDFMAFATGEPVTLENNFGDFHLLPCEMECAYRSCREGDDEFCQEQLRYEAKEEGREPNLFRVTNADT
jgi:hypothetical protein